MAQASPNGIDKEGEITHGTESPAPSEREGKKLQNMAADASEIAFVAKQNSLPIKLSLAVIVVFNSNDSCQGAQGPAGMPSTF